MKNPINDGITQPKVDSSQIIEAARTILSEIETHDAKALSRNGVYFDALRVLNHAQANENWVVYVP